MGDEAEAEMTVGELILLLGHADPAAEVWATWDGTGAALEAKNFYTCLDYPNTVWIDADNNFYRHSTTGRREDDHNDVSLSGLPYAEDDDG